MFYSYPQVVLQEVPGEISLALSISGCDLKCRGCHSSETWDNKFGSELSVQEIEKHLSKHKHISCILFYGGEWNIKELEIFIDYFKTNYKIALYTGRELDFFTDSFINKLDYIKVGPYREDLGALGTETTNQTLYKNIDGVLIDVLK